MTSGTFSSDSEAELSDEVNIRLEGVEYKINCETKLELVTEQDSSDLSKSFSSGELNECLRKSKRMSESKSCEILMFPVNVLPSLNVQIVADEVEKVSGTVKVIVDEEDFLWKDIINEKRKLREMEPVSMNAIEELLDAFEAKAYIKDELNESLNDNADDEDDDDKCICVICLEDKCHDSNVIVLCDGCDLAVHQDCYGVPYIPEGDWYCRRCTRRPQLPAKLKCRLCPNDDHQGAAFKETVDCQWVHMVCALSIRELHFVNERFLEPVNSLTQVKQDRFDARCSICLRRNVGACTQCEHENCFTTFHATCAQSAGYKSNLVAFVVDEKEHDRTSLKLLFYCDRHSENKKAMSERCTLYQEKIAKGAITAHKPRYPQISEKDLEVIKRKSEQLVPEGNFFDKIYTYWRFRRIQKNGAPMPRLLETQSSNDRLTENTEHDTRQETHPAVEKLVNIVTLIKSMKQEAKLERKLCFSRFKTAKIEREMLRDYLSSCIDCFTRSDRSNFFETLQDDRSSRSMSIEKMSDKLKEDKYFSFEHLERDHETMCADGFDFGHCKYSLLFERKTRKYIKEQKKKFMKQSILLASGNEDSSTENNSTISSETDQTSDTADCNDSSEASESTFPTSDGNGNKDKEEEEESHH